MKCQKELVYATTNLEKIVEPLRVARDFGVNLLSIKQVIDTKGSRHLNESNTDQVPFISEGEISYEGNASKKALLYSRWLGRPCIADDTGLELDVLGGLPGIYTARFGIARVCSQLIPGVRYEAAFVTCVAYAEPTGRVVSVSVRLSGVFIFPPDFVQSEYLLPFSAFFIPNGQSLDLQTLIRESQIISHRGRGVASLLMALGCGGQ